MPSQTTQNRLALRILSSLNAAGGLSPEAFTSVMTQLGIEPFATAQLPAANTFKIMYEMTGPGGVKALCQFVGHSTSITNQTPITTYQSLAAAASTQWAATHGLGQLIHNDWSLVGTRAVDISGSTNQEAVDGTVRAGLLGSGPTTLPPNTALVLSWDNGQRYRGGHPRTYVPGMQEGNLATPGGNTWSSTFLTLAQNIAVDFVKDLVAALVPTLADVTIGNLSRWSNSGVHRPSAVFMPWAQTGTVHPRVDSQRRRLGKELP